MLIVTTVVALLVSTSSHMQMISASVEGETSGSNDSSAIMNFKQHKDNPTSSPNPNQQAIDHINQAQSALQNGDTEGAQSHMDLAKQAFGCSPLDPRGC